MAWNRFTFHKSIIVKNAAPADSCKQFMTKIKVRRGKEIKSFEPRREGGKGLPSGLFQMKPPEGGTQNALYRCGLTLF
jgi:hypothetical protein